MQHTLLPLHERVALRREYRVRAAIVFCFTVSLAILLGIAAMFPAFLRASTEARSAEQTAVSLEKEKKNNGLSLIQQSVAQSQKLLVSFTGKTMTTKKSAIIESIVSMRGANKLNSIQILQSGTSTVTVSLQGFAPTRDGLSAFKGRLESSVPGNKVDLPISELAKSTNIPFSLRLVETLP
jgi:hypothetical protein